MKEGVTPGAIQKRNQRARLKAALTGKKVVDTGSRGHTTPAAAARIEHMADIAKKRGSIREKAGQGLVFSDKGGVSAAVQRLRDYEVQCAKELELARKGTDADVELAAHKTWLSAIEQLRKSENDAPKADALNKAQLPKSEVQSEWTRAILVFRNVLDSAAVRISSNPLIAETDRVKLKELLLNEHTRALQSLEKVDWDKLTEGAE